ncbi:MAG: hypothetical protein HY866_23445 [Chloroflexi bacterium]|nr:hypothetical protein [Chloroflexota bacterium]
MRKVFFFLLIVGMVGPLPTPVSARGGSGGGEWYIWLWNYDQQRLARLNGGDSFKPLDVPLSLPEGYKFAGIVDLSNTTILVCMKPDNTETMDTMYGIYNYEAGQFVTEPKSFGGMVSCSSHNIYDYTNYVFSVMTPDNQWNVNVMDMATGEIIYSLSKEQVDPEGTARNKPVVLKVNENIVWLTLLPFIGETTATEFALFEWQMGDDHVRQLGTYPTSVTQFLFNGEAIGVNSARNTVLYQWLNGTPYPIFSDPGFTIGYLGFIQSARKVLVDGVDSDDVRHIFVIDRTAGVMELDATLGGYFIPTLDGFVSLIYTDNGGTEGWNIRLGKDSSEEDSALVWSDPTNGVWLPVDYPSVGVEQGLSSFLAAK